MVYITGSTHGDMECFRDGRLKKLKKNDTLIICGNFGFVWNQDKKEQKLLKWIGKRKYQVLFVGGWYENYDALEKYEPVDFCGGKARRLSGKLMQLQRGNIYEIEGKTFFAFGGGESPDRDERIAADTWYEQELPTKQQLNDGLVALTDHAYQVDYFITHEAPWNVKRLFCENENNKALLQFYFERIEQHVTYQQWYCASPGLDKRIPPKYTCLHQKVLPIQE